MIPRLLLIIAFSSVVCLGCPELPEPPCTCRLIGQHTSIITCKGVHNEIKLKRSVQSMKETDIPIRAVQIFDTSVNYLSSTLFKGLKVPKLTIVDSSMVSLSDTETAFVGLEDSLEILEVQECHLHGGWIWSQLSELRALRELKTVKAGLHDIGEDIKAIAHLDIVLLQLTQDSISHIDDTAFSTFHNLNTLSLKKNMIQTVKRSMFPDPAMKLQQIILSSNLLESIPTDLFSDMPALVSIILENNKLLTVDETAFRPIWTQLKKLNLLNNPLRCDCRLNWILNVRFPRNTWAVCQMPQVLKGVHLKELKRKDLWCA